MSIRSHRKSTSTFLSSTNERLIEQAFRLFDSDQTGTINYRELKTAIRALGFPVHKKDVIEMLDAQGKDLNESIDFNDFHSVVRELFIEEDPTTQLREMFRRLDLDGTGKITPRILKRLSKQVGEQIEDAELDDMIRQFDKNEDGMIDFDEFRIIMKQSDDDDFDDV